MNIEKIVLGFAAAVVSVSGARAADAILNVKPKPVDHVRVCEAYGKGFYYIPGSEACLSVGGYVRFQVNVAGDPVRNIEGSDYQVATRVRARLNFDAREESELGTLRAFARFQTTNTSGNSNGVAIDQAYIQLGGLLMGYRDTLWTSGVGGLEDGLLTDSSLTVGDFNTNQVSYTLSANALSATLGLEDDGTGDVVPDVHGKIVYSGAWGGAYLSAVYDETLNREDLNTVFASFSRFISIGELPTLFQDGNNDAFALKGGILLKNLITPKTQLKIEGYWASDPTVYATISGLSSVNTFAANNSNILNPTTGSLPVVMEYAIGVGFTQAFGEVGVALASQYGKTFDTTFMTLVNGVPTPFETNGSYYAVVGNVIYRITSNFATLAEVGYRNVDFNGVGETDQISGFLRFQHNF